MDSEKDKGSKIGIGCHFCVGFFAGVGSNNVGGVGGARVGCGMETNRSEAGGLVRLADVGVKPSHSIHFGWRCLRNNRWRLKTSGRIGTCVHLKNPLVTDGKRKGSVDCLFVCRFSPKVGNLTQITVKTPSKVGIETPLL